MKRRFYLMRRISTLALGLSLLGLTSISQAQWTAFNDHVPGSANQTSSNATTLKIPAAGGPTTTNIVLKNISTGANLPVTMTIARSGSVTYTPSSTGSTPGVGTPLYNTFNGIVYFGSAADGNVELTNSLSGTVTYTFSGLNPSKLYAFRGGAIRGNSTQFNRWTKVELQSAVSFTNAHSANVATKTQVASLATNQCAAGFGFNSSTNTGDQVGWDNIDPGADGTIS